MAHRFSSTRGGKAREGASRGAEVDPIVRTNFRALLFGSQLTVRVCGYAIVVFVEGDCGRLTTCGGPWIHAARACRFSHGNCYPLLYIFVGDFLLCAELRTSDIDASAGALEEVQRIVSRIRARWPNTPLLLRADFGFCRDGLMAWCE